MPTLDKKTTNRATEFSKNMVRYLNEHWMFNEKHDLSWRRNGMSKEEKVGTVDIVGSTGNGIRIVVEAELLREDPASNVTKVWKWAVENQNRPKKVLMIQAFSKAYKTRKNRAKQLAVFIGKRMDSDVSGITYIAIDIPYNPRPGAKVGAGRRRFHARNLGKRVMQLFRTYK